ncbi:MAG: hypothetical protein ABTD50_06885 [Polyangiaceae bacterium]|jgi:hypothetical protein
MRTLLTCATIVAAFAVESACARKQDDSQPPNTAATAYAGYPQAYPTAPGYPQAGAYPQATAAPTFAPGPYPAAPAPTSAAPVVAPTTPATSATMAVPGPLALPCQNDLSCGTHHCNTQYSKCAFPCQSAADCLSPNQCMAGLCVPSVPQPH